MIGSCAVMLCIAPSALAAPSAPANFHVEPLATGLVAPVGVAWAPDGRMFIAEKAGVVKVHLNGVTTEVIDLSEQINGSGERGLLGIAVDRDFASNGHLYLLSVDDDPLDPDGDGPTSSRLSRITVDPDDEVENSDPGQYPLTTLLVVPAPRIWHTIGTVRVDPEDGTLWVGNGDSGAVPDFTDPYDDDSLAGKILHIGTDGRGLPSHPFCPAETDLTKTCTKVYAKGFRNPFRFTLRGGGKGPVVGDVGARTADEIDLVQSGVNYGWPCYEASSRSPFRQEQQCSDQYALEGTAYEPTGPSLVSPIDPQAGGALIGGPLLESTTYPAAYRERIYFGDWSRGWIRSARVDDDDRLGPAEDFVPDAGFPVDIQVGPDGNLVYVDIGSGIVYRIVHRVPDPPADTERDDDPPASDTAASPGPAASLPAGRGDPAPDASGGSNSTPLAPLRLGTAGGGIRVRRNWSVRLTATHTNAAPWTGSASLTKRVRLASRDFVVQPGSRGTVVLKLNQTGRKLLRRKRRLAVIASFKSRTGETSRTRILLLAPRGPSS